jgi:hypothetical protein
MRSEFLVKTKRGFLNLVEFKNEMDKIMRAQISDEMSMMDKIIVEMFDKRTGDTKTHPPLNSLGKMPASDVLKKFY